MPAGLREVATALTGPGGSKAMQLHVAEQYVAQLGELAKEGNTRSCPRNSATWPL